MNLQDSNQTTYILLWCNTTHCVQKPSFLPLELPFKLRKNLYPFEFTIAAVAITQENRF